MKKGKHRKRIAFFPYKSQNAYIVNIQRILEKYAALIPYEHKKSAFSAIWKSSCIFLNWYENELTAMDRFTLLLGRVLQKKIVWTFHNVLPHSGEIKKGRNDLYFMCRVSTDIILLSHASRKELARLVGNRSGILKKAVYIPHINYCNNYLPEKCDVAPLTDDSFVFLYFGNIRPYKNLEMLIRTFHDLKDRNAVLVIAGNPVNVQYAKKIKSLCEGNRRIRLDFQYIPDCKVFDYMQTADVVVLPYDKRSSMNSGAMIAAFSCRKPVIIPDIAMARDYVDKAYVYQYHYRSEKEHETKLKETMIKAYEAGRKQNLSLGADAYREVKLYNSAQIIQQKLLEIL